ncbi:SRPBCC family protein [Pontibacter locisalis]|uniref:SRPBCC family protein n=1 Tax=Pontibacter locisalis TaxID=1719035 RepID=A0ABW5IRL2_9BACT
MRLLMKVLLSVAVVIVVTLGISFLLPTHLLLERSVVLDAKPAQVYSLLSNPTEWEKWSPVNKSVDPTMIRLFSGPMSGVGAKMQWSGDGVGNGEVELVEATANEKIIYTERDTSNALTIEGAFLLTAAEGNTVIYWSQKARIEDNPFERLKGLWLKYKKENELEEGLLRLKSTFEESNPKKPGRRKLAQAL